MANNITAAFPLLLPSQLTNIYNIILINYRWDGELRLEGAALFQLFSFPGGSSAQKQLAAGKGQG